MADGRVMPRSGLPWLIAAAERQASGEPVR